jgi:hypothetical protein
MLIFSSLGTFLTCVDPPTAHARQSLNIYIYIYTHTLIYILKMATKVIQSTTEKPILAAKHMIYYPWSTRAELLARHMHE